MRVIFKSVEDKKFILGQVSFNWLDKNDVFDKYQKDNDYSSECIFKTNGENVERLSDDILKTANSDDRLRPDIKDKLVRFAEFIKTSNGVSVTCE